MSNSLVGGLYERIKATKLTEKSNSKLYDEMIKVVNGLVSFVNRNPDITNDDIKILASTNADMEKYFSVLFHKFPNIVKEIRDNGSKNILEFIESKQLNSIYSEFQYTLDEIIKKVYLNHKKEITFSVRNQYYYNYLIVNYKKSKSKLIYTNSHCSFSSSGCVRSERDISMKDIAQLVGLVKFYEKAKITEKTLREIIENNYTYDFSAIEMILDARESISEELNQGEYGMIKLIDLFKYLHCNKNEQQKAELK